MALDVCLFVCKQLFEIVLRFAAGHFTFLLDYILSMFGETIMQACHHTVFCLPCTVCTIIQDMYGQWYFKKFSRWNQGLETTSIGMVRKNSGGKRQAYYQPQVSTCNARWAGSWLLAISVSVHWPVHFHWCHTWVVRLRGASAESDRRHTCNQLTGTRPAFFHCYFSLPPYWTTFTF